ncbi:hypothetical protein BU25DRAFT_168322 [Macroventuria anomochaeta]|uniref:Uncharacterized protein n=1 Tax=Macroventuria anomochaeta TaxID=301207 RepID=A0ACB6RPN8_9PLEO|nr:uncharacterized protein BU25DRAFT_168322 [Macroventuria anomochaeta]KAF2623851.1 hypothetical protein BU25DRAFT_168322 [Macroventuria anomochaeta]
MRRIRVFAFVQCCIGCVHVVDRDLADWKHASPRFWQRPPRARLTSSRARSRPHRTAWKKKTSWAKKKKKILNLEPGTPQRPKTPTNRLTTTILPADRYPHRDSCSPPLCCILARCLPVCNDVWSHYRGDSDSGGNGFHAHACLRYTGTGGDCKAS